MSERYTSEIREHVLEKKDFFFCVCTFELIFKEKRLHHTFHSQAVISSEYE